MPSGGHARSGPAPDPMALRRDRDKAEWTRLPSEGRAGAPPVWPLTRPTARERQLWTEEWRRPQAVMWEASGQVREVALYVRALRDAERPQASVASRTLVRQHMDALGLTLDGLRRNRWIIEDGQAVAAAIRVRPMSTSSARDRLKVVAGGA